MKWKIIKDDATIPQLSLTEIKADINLYYGFESLHGRGFIARKEYAADDFSLYLCNNITNGSNMGQYKTLREALYRALQLKYFLYAFDTPTELFQFLIEES